MSHIIKARNLYGTLRRNSDRHKREGRCAIPGEICTRGLTVSEFKAWLQQHWPSVKAALLAGDYQPAAIRKVEMPKPKGGVRTLGIPTVLDRLIQQ
ncbi:MAG: hypothetical protein Q8N89_13520, partial [Azonexus sp.]|nr:hypothetical protein [Azonexus sp.]